MFIERRTSDAIVEDGVRMTVVRPGEEGGRRLVGEMLLLMMGVLMSDVMQVMRFFIQQITELILLI